MGSALGVGTTAEFFAEEYKKLDLNDERLNKRAQKIFATMQKKLGSCIRRVF